MLREFLLIKHDDNNNLARLKLVLQYFKSLSARAQILWLAAFILLLLYIVL
jgi:predicted nucleic acid-binding Zn ribbon protein